MMTVTRQRIYLAGFGLVLGYCLERIGFANFGEVHRLFVFADFRLLFTFMGAVTSPCRSQKNVRDPRGREWQ